MAWHGVEQRSYAIACYAMPEAEDERRYPVDEEGGEASLLNHAVDQLGRPGGWAIMCKRSGGTCSAMRLS